VARGYTGRTVKQPRDCTTLLIYGGTFDPPHRAHVELPFIAADRIDADGVLFIPAGQPPHKPSDSGRTPAKHRAAMIRLAAADKPNAWVDTREIDRAGPSYTVDTLRALRDELPGVTLRLLIGADMALIFDKWREPAAIERLAEPVVMIRPPHDRSALLGELPAASRDRWADRIVEVPAMEVSSTAIRRAIAAGRLDQVADDLPAPVVDYIREHHLYGAR